MQKPVASQIPQGVGAPPPPGMDPRKGKLMCIKVRMLDDTIAVFHLGHKATGLALFDEVCRHLNLLESDYFGLEFIDGYGNRCWLDKEKSILRQITNTQSDARFYFVVKFYTPNPADLEEEYTRYLLALQIRRDLARGELVCNENTAALLVSYVVQSDCGDYSTEDYPDHTYLSVRCFVPNQTAQFQMKVMENHKKLIGMSPGEADLALLETARRCDFYGIKLHPAKDIEGTEVNLAVAHMGIKVFHQLQCVSVFSWAKIRKLSFKRRRLMIKLHPESYQYYKETIEFGFETRNEAKNFWKKCVEHHAFFRCIEVIDAKKDGKTTKLFSRGSSFKYHGRTQKQLIDYVREHRKRREPFTRPLKPGEAMSRAGSATRHIQFNVIDATKMPPPIYPEGYGSLGRPGSHRSATASSEDEKMAYGAVRVQQANVHPIKTMPNGTSSHQKGIQGQCPVYYPPGTSLAQQAGYGSVAAGTITSNGRNRPKSAYNAQPAPGYASDSERMCVSDLESNVAEVYMPSKALQKPQKQDSITSKPQEIHKTSSSGANGGPDTMSTSLPNVLADDIKVVCKEIELYPPKSASGEFLDDVRVQHDFHDDISEGSYRLADYDKDAKPGLQGQDSSSQSDVGTAGVDPRVYSTTFTTKRIGNVVVKRVTGGSASGRPRREPGSGDDDDSSSYSDYRSMPSAGPSRGSGTYASLMKPGLSRFKDAVPIPIDGPEATPPRSLEPSISTFAAPQPSAIASTSPQVATTSAMATVVATSSRPSTGSSSGTTATPTSRSTSGSGASVATIIRPIVLSTGGTPPRSIAPPPHKPIVVHPIASVAKEETKYTSVYRIRNYEPSGGGTTTVQGSSMSTFSPVIEPSPNSSFRSFAAPTSSKESSLGAQDPSQKRHSTPPETTSKSSPGPVTYGATKPLPGKIIHKDNMVITPSGIVAKEEIIALRKEKPMVPPKPKGLVSKVRLVAEATIPTPTSVQVPIVKPETSTSPEPVYQVVEKTEKSSKVPPPPPPKPSGGQKVVLEPHVQASTAPEDVDRLLAPLDSILNDAQELSSILSTGKTSKPRPEVAQKPTEITKKALETSKSAHEILQLAESLPETSQKPLEPSEKPKRPTLISVESVDEPEIKKYHIFDDGIPMTLTVKQTPGSSTEATAKTIEALLAGREEDMPLKLTEDIDKLRETSKRHFDQLEKRKSLEFVSHPVRTRDLPPADSFSSLDHSISPTDPNSGNIAEYLERRRSLSTDKKRRDRRSDLRRQTQPVRFVVQEVPDAIANLMASLPQVSPLEDESEKVKSESRAVEKPVMEFRKNVTPKKAKFESKSDEDEPSEELPAPPPPLDWANIKPIDESSPESREEKSPIDERKGSTQTQKAPENQKSQEHLYETPKSDQKSSEVQEKPPESPRPVPSTSRTESGVLETDF